jgi:hypothetical protein
MVGSVHHGFGLQLSAADGVGRLKPDLDGTVARIPRPKLLIHFWCFANGGFDVVDVGGIEFFFLKRVVWLRLIAI